MKTAGQHLDQVLKMNLANKRHHAHPDVITHHLYHAPVKKTQHESTYEETSDKPQMRKDLLKASRV